MTICIFDWTAGGHHEIYVRRCVQALRHHHDVVAAVPNELAAELESGGISTFRLGDARPREDFSRPLKPQHDELGLDELDRLEAAVDAIRPSQVLHLYADPIIRRLVRRPSLPCRLSLLVFFPRSHYPRVFGSPLTAGEQVRARFLDIVIRRWAWRRDAHALLTLDPFAAERWTRHLRLRASWFPEPPVPELQVGETFERTGCVLYGVISRHKGLEYVTEALTLDRTAIALTLAGPTAPEYEQTRQLLVNRMRSAQVNLNLKPSPYDEEAGLAEIAQARCVLLPYPRHFGMSRVLVEAASVGTPVVANDFGLVGHLVRQNRLGMAVDCHDAVQLRAAMERLISPEAQPQYAAALERFAARHDTDPFRARLLDALS